MRTDPEIQTGDIQAGSMQNDGRTSACIDTFIYLSIYLFFKKIQDDRGGYVFIYLFIYLLLLLKLCIYLFN